VYLSSRREASSSSHKSHCLRRQHRFDNAVAQAVKAYATHMSVELQKRREEHLSFVIHDLRTPLQAVSLATPMLERSLPDASKTELFAPLLSSSTNVNGYTSVILLAQLNNSFLVCAGRFFA
jgi:signal transduction histidine kinase